MIDNKMINMNMSMNHKNGQRRVTKRVGRHKKRKLPLPVFSSLCFCVLEDV